MLLPKANKSAWSITFTVGCDGNHRLRFLDPKKNCHWMTGRFLGEQQKELKGGTPEWNPSLRWQKLIFVWGIFQPCDWFSEGIWMEKMFIGTSFVWGPDSNQTSTRKITAILSAVSSNSMTSQSKNPFQWRNKQVQNAENVFWKAC